jgi:hypothetical protein
MAAPRCPSQWSDVFAPYIRSHPRMAFSNKNVEKIFKSN